MIPQIDIPKYDVHTYVRHVHSKPRANALGNKFLSQLLDTYISVNIATGVFSE